MKAIVVRDYRQDDRPRLQAIHDAARQDELRLAGLEKAFLPWRPPQNGRDIKGVRWA